MSALKPVTIISSPITERYVRPNMLAMLDTEKNLIQASGVWFPIDDRWVIRELEPQDQIVKKVIIGDLNKKPSLEEYNISCYILFDGKQISSTDAIKLYKQQGKTFDELWERLTKENQIDDAFSKEIVQVVKNNMFKQWEMQS